MDYKKYARNLSWMQLALAASMIANIVLSIAALFFLISYQSKEIITRIIPPQLTKEAIIGSRSANAAYKKGFSLLFVNQVANLQPLSAPGIIDAMSAFVSPSIYNEFRKQALELIQDPMLNAAAVSTDFSAHQVHYEKETDRVFVVGTLHTTGPGIDKTRNIVYEITVGITDGRPWVTHFTSYLGNIPQSLSILLGKVKNKLDEIDPSRQPISRRAETPEAQAEREMSEEGVIVERDDVTESIKNVQHTESRHKEGSE